MSTSLVRGKATIRSPIVVSPLIVPRLIEKTWLGGRTIADGSLAICAWRMGTVMVLLIGLGAGFAGVFFSVLTGFLTDFFGFVFFDLFVFPTMIFFTKGARNGRSCSIVDP